MREQNSNVKKFTIKMQKKLVVLFVFVLLAFAGLGVRLGYLVKEKGTNYQKQVLSQQRYDSSTIPFRRGDIVDAKGNKLATSKKVYNLVIDAAVMLDKEAYLEPTLQALSENFPALDLAAVREYVVSHPRSSWYVPLKRLDYEEISGFKQAQQENSNIKGVWFDEEYKRVYPGGSLAADVIGFARADNQGQYGLEEYYNSTLNGINGREYGYLNDDLALERTIKAAVDGNTIHSTIDMNIQKIVEKYLLQFHEEYKDNAHEGNGAENIGCIIMEVDTGNILAMASYPVFDLNDTKNTDALLGSKMIEQITNASGYYELKKTDTIITEGLLESMTEEQILLNLNNLWKNYCISSTYEPGSTVKPFTVAAALESGSISTNMTYECKGSLEVGGHNIHCHNVWGDGVINLKEALAYSCNVAMMKIALATGKETFCEFQDIFNFGLKTNIDLAGEARTVNLLFPQETMGAADLATNSFGQNFNTTMIQVIAGYCSLINGGYYYEPHMVDKITNASGATVENIEPRVLKQTVSAHTSDLIKVFCKAVVEEGTGKTARPAGYAIGGKTGTAETHPRDKEEFVVSFIGHAPADNPKIAIYVVVDRANAQKQDSARYATGIVRNILSEVLPYMNIFMTEELSEAEKKELEEKKLEDTLKYGKPLQDTDKEDAEEEASTVDRQEPVWKSFPVDAATGYLKNPETGELLDPITGASATKNVSISGEVPVNPAIVNPQAEVK